MRKSFIFSMLTYTAYGATNGGDFFPLPEEAVSDSGSTEVECTLDCLNGSVCVKGNQSLVGHATQPSTGLALTFHEELHRDGWHCDCPPGLTGLLCGETYENCNDGEHVCYNGGSCIPGLEDRYGNEQLYCNCETAIDKQNPTKQYKGKYCEQEIVIDVGECDEGGVCQHGGTCKVSPDFHSLNPCDCPVGFSGKYCEYVKDTVPDCTKTCLNQGICRLGDGNDETELCECPSSFYGEQCEKEAEKCGDDYCYHGSKCFEIILGNGSTEHICDCTRAFTEENSYAGEFCQYPSTVFCTGHDDPNGRQFCTNGGECPQDRHLPCSCLPNFMGPRCAFEIGKDGGDYAECELACQNGGTCQKGIKDLQKAFGNFASDVSHMLNQTHDNFEHCVCPKDFYGIRCEYQAEECGEGEHICFHGSECVSSEDDLGCNCETSEQKTAGLFCEFFATDECAEQPQISDNENRGFCTNGGYCMKDDDG